VRDALWPAPWGRNLTLLFIALGLTIPAAIVTMRFAPRWVNGPVAWVGYSWMGFIFYFFVLVLASDLGRGFFGLLRALPDDPERRQFLARAVSAGIASVSGVVGFGGLIMAARGFVIKRVQVPLEKFPASADGYSIAQITDLHVGPTLGAAYVADVVRQTNALNPDLIVITGDLVDGSVDQLREHVEPLRHLSAKDGVFFVTGNHEYYSGAVEWIAHLETLGIRVLRNERVDIRGVFDLAGVDDISADRMEPGHGQDMAKATQGRDPSRALVMLAHQPKSLKDSVAAGVDLQLSGHVHAGQIFPFNWLAHLDQPYISGLHRKDKTWIYVSAGTGYWGPPMRVGTTAEITRIELVASQSG
jgi:predicted MPP superfamily phosphohydrolase